MSEELLGLVNQIIEEVEDELTAFERRFLEDMTEDLEAGKNVTEKQAGLIHEIWTEKVAGV